MKKNETPEELFEELFYEVHTSGIFSDGKVFADARAKMSPSIILKEYNKRRNDKDFDLEFFVRKYFDLEQHKMIPYRSDGKQIEAHLNDLWDHLKRDPDKKRSKDSRIPLPFSYIVPGGRFNEIYYWDSYFTILGLITSGRIELAESMINNFTYLIDTYGHIPNGSRTYFLSRSQPPFYSLMIAELIKQRGKSIIKNYLPSLVKEYNFWMKGTNQLSDYQAINRVVKLDGTLLLNRYYDHKNTPRMEMYRNDWALIDFKQNRHDELFRNLRSACESGWDFSSRWLKDQNDLTSIEILDILPIDLNCLLWHHEKLISECYKEIGQDELSLNYGILSVNRKKAIQSIFWNKKRQFYCDYNHRNRSVSDKCTLAGCFPLFFKLATEDQAMHTVARLQDEFIKDGGLVTTPINSGQQWDAPNGWAPLQYMAIKGLLNYGYKALAQEVAFRWINLNEKIYNETGKMMEKYNVMDTTLTGAGGEYDLQDGFGWTNGVYLALKAM